MDIKGTEVFEELFEVDSQLKQEWDKELDKMVTVPKYEQIVLYGGSRSSKSWSLMQLMFIRLCQSTALKVTVWRKTKKTCRDTIMKDWKKILLTDPHKNNLFRENKQEGSFTHKVNGSIIIFEGADDEGKVHGMTQDISIFNEITEFSEDVYLQITQRTALKVYVDYNPSKRFWHEKYKKDPNTIYLHSWLGKNSFCPRNIKKRIMSYEPWESGSYDVIDGIAMYKGKPISENHEPPTHKINVAAKTARKYNWLVYGLGLEAEKPNKIYLGWKMISDEYYHKLPYPKYNGLDFGTASPNAFVEVKYDGEKSFYLHEVLYHNKEELNGSLSSKMSKLLGKDKKERLIVADSAKQSIINDLADDGFFIVGAKKGTGSVELGIQRVQEFNIFYTMSSQNIDTEYSVYSWMLDTHNKPTDFPLKKDDHIMDAIRYVISYLYVYLGIGVKLDK